MARTFQEIAQSIFDDKNSRSELNSLNSTSKAAIFRNWVFVAANAQQNLEIIQDRYKIEIETLIANNAVGTPSWYVERVKEFQLGDDLVLEGNLFKYQTIDPEKQIVAACSFIESTGGTITLKTAKMDGVALQALGSTELNQLKKYVTKIKLAGTRINIISLNPDQLIMSGCTVYYDSIFDPSIVQAAVEDALQGYMNALPFDGKIRLNDVIDTVQNVTGVIDVTLADLAIKSGSVVSPVGRSKDLPSGYLVEGTTLLSFDNLISYVAS